MWIKSHFYPFGITFSHAVQTKRLIIQAGYFCGVVGKEFIANSAMAGTESVSHLGPPLFSVRWRFRQPDNALALAIRHWLLPVTLLGLHRLAYGPGVRSCAGAGDVAWSNGVSTIRPGYGHIQPKGDDGIPRLM